MTHKRTPVIYTHPQMPLADLRTLLSGADLPWAYVARLDRACLRYGTADLPQAWPEGRAFGPPGEVRWQQRADGQYRVDVLTETPGAFLIDDDRDGWARATPQVDGVRARDILLWGALQREADAAWEWIEIRIPRPLEYPIDPAHPQQPQGNREVARVILRGYDYTIGGIPVATRWATLEQDTRSA